MATFQNPAPKKMVLALDPIETLDYICLADRDLPKEEQTVFSIKPLSAKEKMTLDSRYMGASASNKQGQDVETHFSMDLHRRSYDALTMGLKGWRNFKGADGESVPFVVADKKGARIISDATISRIPETVRAELSEAILDGFSAETVRD